MISVALKHFSNQEFMYYLKSNHEQKTWGITHSFHKYKLKMKFYTEESTVYM